jgi:hypothetical protein
MLSHQFHQIGELILAECSSPGVDRNLGPMEELYATRETFLKLIQDIVPGDSLIQYKTQAVLAPFN